MIKFKCLYPVRAIYLRAFHQLPNIVEPAIKYLYFEAEKEVEHVNITAQQDRKYYMECTIVRIMKTRKVLKHAALVNEVSSSFQLAIFLSP